MSQGPLTIRHWPPTPLAFPRRHDKNDNRGIEVAPGFLDSLDWLCGDATLSLDRDIARV